MIYAGIGARQTPPEILRKMRAIGRQMARAGHQLATGAAKGADQAFAKGAATVSDARITLYLPWQGYEREWIQSILLPRVTPNVVTHIDAAALASVSKYHPAPDRLSAGVVKLHARNYNIIRHAELVICYTPGGNGGGGTGQAIRIARDRGIPVHDLGIPNVLAAYERRLLARRQAAGMNIPAPPHKQR